MNIVTTFPQINLNTANPRTEAAQRENQLRERIPAATESQAQSPVLTEEQRAKYAQQPNQQSAGQYQEKVSLGQQQVQEREQRQSSDQQSQQQSQSEQQAEQRQLEQQIQQIEKLQVRDDEVRAHEQAHASVGGQYAGTPQYEFKRGPDGQNYAVSGEVAIDIAKVSGDPHATIDKMEQVRAAALAPAQPSSQDRKIAAEASAIIAEARAELISGDESEDDSGGRRVRTIDDNGATFHADQSVASKTERQLADTADFYQQVADEQQRPERQQRVAREVQVERRAMRIASFYDAATQPFVAPQLSLNI